MKGEKFLFCGAIVKPLCVPVYGWYIDSDGYKLEGLIVAAEVIDSKDSVYVTDDIIECPVTEMKRYKIEQTKA